jgi:hypothetical protein
MHLQGPDKRGQGEGIEKIPAIKKRDKLPGGRFQAGTERPGTAPVAGNRDDFDPRVTGIFQAMVTDMRNFTGTCYNAELPAGIDLGLYRGNGSGEQPAAGSRERQEDADERAAGKSIAFLLEPDPFSCGNFP